MAHKFVPRGQRQRRIFRRYSFSADGSFESPNSNDARMPTDASRDRSNDMAH